MTFDDILKKYREAADNKVQLGTSFEKLMQRFLLTYSMYRGKFSDVWLWNEFPYREQISENDIGIDIVARTVEGEFWAIQCKCFQEYTRIDKPMVDTFLSTSGKMFEVDGKFVKFSNRLWISTTDLWNPNASKTIENQDPPVTRLGLYDLQSADIDWQKIEEGKFGKNAVIHKMTPRPALDEIQNKAVNAVNKYFKTHDRGKLIMACGTGKTYTSLKIVENELPNGGIILFLVPSISLLSQTLREWTRLAKNPINAICVCSDNIVSKADDDISSVDLALPATTDIEKLVNRIKNTQKDNLTVIFSTYQSVDIVAAAQKNLNFAFDLMICDEAHRTSGFAEAGGDQSNFVRVHDNNFINAKKRLYMTATPKLYTTNAKKSATSKDLLLWSMDDEKYFGKDIYVLKFSEAIELGLLSDYRVLTLTVSDDFITPTLKDAINNIDEEINIDDANKLIGCINALSKQMSRESQYIINNDPGLMHTAVAFCANIKNSKHIANIFNNYSKIYRNDVEDKSKIVKIIADHVDGTMKADERQKKIESLKKFDNEETCKILTNARCLSEGVDVPSLDAVLFLSPKKSEIDIIQAVGRVLRRPQDGSKNYGYVIIPVVIPSNASANEILDKSKDFDTVWKVLNALKAHDDKFYIEVNKIALNNYEATIGGKFIIDTPPKFNPNITLNFDLHSAILAKIVEKVGDSDYWETWGRDVAVIAERHKSRIKELISTDGEHQTEFEKFLKSLHKNINPSISEDEAIDMLSQHLITRPVFESLFENYNFMEQNPVSRSMQRIVELLDKDGISKEREAFEGIYKSVRERCSGIQKAADRQKIIIELYDKFFKVALKKTVDKLGIVYTPVEVVDFILNSVNDVLKKEFDCSLSTPGVKILDPFSGTGTFLARLIQSGLIRDENLDEKYQNDLNANEIVLLAYYISCINIENAYHERRGSENYKSFDKMCLTDTFQLGEDGGMDTLDDEIFAENSKQVQNQKKIKDLKVIVGNPPYSIGQRSAMDDAQNEHYKNIENRITNTYAKYTDAQRKVAIFDSYVKAFRWASDRIGDSGIIGFVTNSYWLDSAATDGLRKCFEEEFTSIYVFNLRGNARTSGEERRKEAGNVFGSGSRAPISITILVKNGNQKPNSAKIYYTEVDDYLSRDEKLSTLVNLKSILSEKNKRTLIKPNAKHDWINVRGDSFDKMIILGDKKDKNLTEKVFYDNYSAGILTARDSWCYNFSKESLQNNIKHTIKHYNDIVISNSNNLTDNFDSLKIDSTKLILTRATKNNIKRKIKYTFDETKIVECCYRPFIKSNLYYDKYLNEMTYQTQKLFPTRKEKNLLICVPGTGNRRDFSVLMTSSIIDFAFADTGTQCFPLYYYEPPTEGDLFSQDKMICHDGITDYILQRAHHLYNDLKITKEDIFYYVYGFLHLPTYREQFANELKKSLPRIILVPETSKFWQLSQAGRDLAEIHLNYENQEPPNDIIVEISKEDYKVTDKKMRLSADKTTLQYNQFIKIKNIPPRANKYIVNGRSPLEWIIDRYYIKIDKDSKIENNPNLWCSEHNDEKYILNLILSTLTVSLKTLDIVDSLPSVAFN